MLLFGQGLGTVHGRLDEVERGEAIGEDGKVRKAGKGKDGFMVQSCSDGA